MNVREDSFRRAVVAVALLTALVFASSAAAQPAPNAQPTGGVVVAGSAAISHTASTTMVAQSTQRAVVNWKSFDVGSMQTMVVQAPDAHALTLLRVTNPNPSLIAGKVVSNGQVVITDANGAVLDRGVQVNTAGFVAAVPGVSNASFMNGTSLKFVQPGTPNGQVTNAGTITTRGAGLTALIAPAVSNTSDVTDRLGTVELLGAKTATIALYGDLLFGVAAKQPVTQVPVAGGTRVTSLIKQSGMILAQGGAVVSYAAAADGLINTLSSNSGQINADTVGNRTGSIRIGGVGGSMTLAGQLQARGIGPGDVGGKIQLLASNGVIVGAKGAVDASGAGGGGTIALGTTLARASGGPSVAGQRVSRNVSVAKGAVIAANATGKGNGGKIVGLSTQKTGFHGMASVTGGATAGNGGLIELSGPTLDLTGSTLDTSAPHGTTGTILLDPRRLIL